MREFAIRSLLGAGLSLGACYTHAKAEGAATLTLEEAKKAEGHVLASKEFKPSPKGQTSTTESLIEMKGGKMTISMGDKKMEGAMIRSEGRVTSTVSLGDNKARRTVEKITANSKMILNGQERPMPADDEALLGVPVLLEYKDGKLSATREDGASPKGDQVKALEELNKSMNRNNDFAMYGDTPHKVGDKWNVDPKDLTAFGETRNASGTYTLEFAEITEFQGTPCAVLKAQFDIAFEGTDNDKKDGGSMKMTLKGTAIVHRSLADQEDLEAKISGDMTVDTNPQPGTTMHVEGPMSETQKTVLKRP